MISNRRIDWEKKLTIRQRRWVSYPLAGFAMSVIFHLVIQGYMLFEQILFPTSIVYLMWGVAFAAGVALVNEWFNFELSSKQEDE